jgi:cell wall-associated NlpC family hydrolase
MGSATVDNRRMDRFHLRPDGRRARPAAVAPTLAEAHAGVQARLEGLIQASHRHQADLERSELALRATRAEYAGDVRDLYARGALAPLELLLAAGDMHELALATARTEVRARSGPRSGGRRRPGGPWWRPGLLGPGRWVRGPGRRPRPNPTAAAAVRTALGQVGKPYRWGATGPATFDCSGLVRFAHAHAGLSLPRTSRQQWSAGRHVRVADLRSGDLVFFAHDPDRPGTIHHVGMYVGQGLMVHAPHTGALVRVDAVRPGGHAGATRPGRRPAARSG